MEPTEIIAAIAAAQSLMAFVMRQMALAHQNGQFTDEQVQQIRTAAAVSDQQWDDACAEARKRIGDGGGSDANT